MKDLLIKILIFLNVPESWYTEATDLKSLVIAEAKKLKKQLTKDESSMININNLNPSFIDSCIYGLATGNCLNSRAIKLIELSCNRIYKKNSNYHSINSMTNKNLNGSPKKESRIKYWSPIEVFIANTENSNNGNNERLVNYLNGTSDKLKLI